MREWHGRFLTHCVLLPGHWTHLRGPQCPSLEAGHPPPPGSPREQKSGWPHKEWQGHSGHQASGPPLATSSWNFVPVSGVSTCDLECRLFLVR